MERSRELTEIAKKPMRSDQPGIGVQRKVSSPQQPGKTMLKLVQGVHNGTKKDSTIQASVIAYLDDRFQDDESGLARLDRWSIDRVMRQNRAKAALVEEAHDPREHCVQNLIREIDAEAQVGVFLPGPARHAAQLRRLAGEHGITGRLDLEMARIAPTVFAEEARRSGPDLDVVWNLVSTRYDRAHIEAETSELILMHLSESEVHAADAVDDFRSVFYAFHEDRLRRSFDLEDQLDDESGRRLVATVAELGRRAGSYATRIEAILRRAETG
jgi:hypothetical protein